MVQKDQIYQPTDKEIDEKLSKAKSMNKNILKDTHPEQYEKEKQ